MPNYVLPTFNITANVYTFDATDPDWPDVPTMPPRLAGQICQLTYGRRVNVQSTGGTDEEGVPLICTNLLIPKGTDIRGLQDSVGQDVVEAPAGTGQWYVVAWVLDIARGFTNEHRTAVLLPLAGTWVAPYA